MHALCVHRQARPLYFFPANVLLLLLGPSLKRQQASTKLAEFEAVVVETSQMPHTMMPHCCRIDLRHQRVENRLGDIVCRRQSGANAVVPGVAERAKN